MGQKCSTSDLLAKAIEDDDMDTMAILRKVSVISTLKKKELTKLAQNLIQEDFKRGQFIMKYGEDGTEFYIIVKGKCGVLTNTGEKVAELAAGDFVGEMALLEKAKRNASIECLEDCTTLVASKEVFDSVLGDSTKVRFKKRTAKRKAVFTVVNDNEEEKKDSSKVVDKTDKQVKWLLKSVEKNILFTNLDRKVKLGVIATMYQETVKVGTVLIKQGDVKAQTFYVIDSGSFAVHVDGEQVTTLKEGQCFGELALIHDAPRAATVVAAEDSIIWTMRRNAFRRNVRAAKKQGHLHRVHLLRQVKQFKSLTKRQLGTLSGAFIERTYKNNDVVIKQDEIGESFFVVKSGEVKWETASGESGKRTKGEYFGERALIYNQKRAATITALTTTVCLELSKQDFQELLGPLVDQMKKQIEHEDQKSEEHVRKSEKVVHGARGSSLLKRICNLKQLKTIGILGKGAFGVVSLVVDPSTGNSYALKAMKKCQIAEMGFQDHIVNEKDVMLLLHNDFLVNLRGTFKDTLRVYLLLDVCLGGELFTILRKHRYFNDNVSRFFTACVVEAFAYMHSLNVIYRDLKPENLVLDDKGFLKVTDFGFAKQIEDQTYTLCGTPEYFAPEIVTGQGHGKGVDWWTLGILIYEMLASFSPFFDDQPIGIYRKIVQGRLKFPRHLSHNAKDMIKGLLKSKPTKRLGVLCNGDVDKIRKMEWFNGFSWEDLRAFDMEPPIKPKVKSQSDISNFKRMRADKEDATPIRKSQEFDSTF